LKYQNLLVYILAILFGLIPEFLKLKQKKQYIYIKYK